MKCEIFCIYKCITKIVRHYFYTCRSFWTIVIYFRKRLNMQQSVRQNVILENGYLWFVFKSVYLARNVDNAMF